MEKQLYEIPAIAMGVLQAKLDKLNKKAVKAGTGDIKLVRVGRKTDEMNRQIYIVAIEGEPVKFEGYTFIARLDHNTDPSGASNIVYTMPGEELTTAMRYADASCQHCGYLRSRKDTFVLRNDEDNQLIQVGRTCLKDFFGHDPAEVARRAQYIVKVHDTIREAGEGGKAYMTDRRHIDLVTFLSYVVRSVESHGWVSVTKARETEYAVSSRDDAIDNMFDKVNLGPSNEHLETVEKAIEFALTLDPTKSDFNFNMAQMAKLEIIDYKATGIAAAMVFCYNRHLEQQAEHAKPKQDLSGSVYVGELKERLTINVTVLSSKQMEGHFGPYNLTRMLDDSGNLYVSFGTFKADHDTRIQIRGTVKRFDEFKGVKQTILARVMEVK